MRRWLVAGLLALAAGRAGAADVALPPITRTTLDNGLKVVVAEYHELPLVELYLVVGAGAAQDPAGKEGLADLTAAALKRGAGTRSADEMARAIESLGGAIGAAAGTDGTTINAEFLSSDFAAGLELLRAVLREPTFARDEVRRVRDEQVAAITASLEDASHVAERCYAAFVYGTHPYGRPMEGRRATVARLGRGDVEDFYDRWYRPNNTVLVLVGDVQAPDAVARLRDVFATWRPGKDAVPARAPVPSPHTQRRLLVVDKPDATQAQIRFGNLSLRRADPDYVAATVGNAILGGGFTSQLIEELRVKRSLTYAAWSTYSARMTGGDFRLGTFTKSPTTVETLALALDVEGGFRSRAPEAAALRKIKTFLRGQFPLKLETPDALAARLAEIEFQGLAADELETYRERVEALTPAEVQRVTAARMPAPETVQIVVVGKAADIRAPLEAKFGPATVVTPEACEDPAGLAAR
ncbi:MAG: pitrilysin family protein [Candidatus Binatia bacterium]